jgi:hypothetical protein
MEDRGKPSKLRTFTDWTEPLPGYREIDFAAHGDSSIQGPFVCRQAGDAYSVSYRAVQLKKIQREKQQSSRTLLVCAPFCWPRNL